MPNLLNAIRSRSKDAANALEEANIRSDEDIKTLSRQDLNELLPGRDKLRLRREIFEIINKKNSISELLRQVKEFIPESFRAALSNNGVLEDYLLHLKEQKSLVDQVRDFVDAHINFLESMKDTTPHSEPDKGNHVSASDGSLNNQTVFLSQGAKDSWSSEVPMRSPSASPGHDSDGKKSYDKVEDLPVPYKMVVHGTTFGAHQQVLDKLEKVPPSETNNDQKVTLLFCVISSRVGSDVDAALAEVKDDKPIILVLMHHSRTPTVTTSQRPWAHDGNDANIVTHVEVFFHETVQGLVRCAENVHAISLLQRKLLDYCIKVKPSGPGTKGSKKETGSKSGKDGKKLSFF